MEESKAQLTDRWRRENREEEVAQFRKQVRDDYRAQEMSRKEAHERAWSAAARNYPPLLPLKPTSEPITAPAHSKPTVNPTLSPLDQPIAAFWREIAPASESRAAEGVGGCADRRIAKCLGQICLRDRSSTMTMVWIGIGQ